LCSLCLNASATCGAGIFWPKAFMTGGSRAMPIFNYRRTLLFA
jgi:hypothetical protein